MLNVEVNLLVVLPLLPLMKSRALLFRVSCCLVVEYDLAVPCSHLSRLCAFADAKITIENSSTSLQFSTCLEAGFISFLLLSLSDGIHRERTPKQKKRDRKTILFHLFPETIITGTNSRHPHISPLLCFSTRVPRTSTAPRSVRTTSTQAHTHPRLSFL